MLLHILQGYSETFSMCTLAAANHLHIVDWDR